VLYIILSGITHGAGLDFNRALLLLDDGARGELRASQAVGPASRAEAHRIWEEMEDAGLTLDDLLASWQAAANDAGAGALARRFAGLTVTLGDEAPSLEGADVPLADLVARVAHTAQPLWSNELRANWRPRDESDKPLILQQVACVPLVLDGRVLGVIVADNAYNGRPVTEDRVRGLTTLGNLAAIAIDRARLHGRLQDMAHRDGLTGVFNRRHYEGRLSTSLDRARRSGRRVALLVVDIDHFKQVNDVHGHELGDRALIAVAGLLRAGLREGDLLARYGGEEFVILLDGELDEGAALARAEEVRLAVRDASVAGRPVGELTVSIGVALGPDDANERGIFARADAAMYAAKRAGRDRCLMGD